MTATSRTARIAARWLAIAATIVNAALPVLAHSHGLGRLDAGRVQVCAGGEIRWVRVDNAARADGPAPGRTEGSLAADVSACPVCAAFAENDAMAATGGAHTPPVVDRAPSPSAAPAPTPTHGRWLAAPARAPPPLHQS